MTLIKNELGKDKRSEDLKRILLPEKRLGFLHNLSCLPSSIFSQFWGGSKIFRVKQNKNLKQANSLGLAQNIFGPKTIISVTCLNFLFPKENEVLLMTTFKPKLTNRSGATGGYLGGEVTAFPFYRKRNKFKQVPIHQ
jgi:hypothetical protein